MQTTQLLGLLKEKGARLTKVRTQLVALFAEQPHPLDYTSIIDALAVYGLRVNKTTVYRELDFLQGIGILQEVEFGEGKKRYELAGQHHHHLVCTQCEGIEAVELPGDLAKEESVILAATGFRVTRHLLEFFGICRACQKKGTTV